MIDVGLISDLHFGHAAIANMRGFDDIDEYNEEIIRRYNSVAGKRTMMLIAGDITMEDKSYYHLLDRLLGRKIIIGGNHDLKENMKYLLPHVEAVVGAMKYKGFIITHIPIHPYEVSRFIGNIHGHNHTELMKRWRYAAGGYIATEEIDKRYFNISWDRLDGIPISFTQLLTEFKK